MGPQLTSRRFIVDSWPVLEWLQERDPGRENFRHLLRAAAAGSASLEMSRINYGEVIYSIRKSRSIADPQRALNWFVAAPFLIHSIDDALVDAAVDLKSQYAFAYADAFAAALSIRLKAPLASGDTEFRALEAGGLLRLHWMGA